MQIKTYPAPDSPYSDFDSPAFHSLRIAGWALFAAFAAASAALLYPLAAIEDAMRAGHVPPLPREMTDLLASRHYWHAFTTLAFVLALCLRRDWLRRRSLRWGSWLAIGLLWLLLYLGSTLIGFYMSLYTLWQFNFELRVRDTLAWYTLLVLIVIVVWGAWRAR